MVLQGRELDQCIPNLLTVIWRLLILLVLRTCDSFRYWYVFHTDFMMQLDSKHEAASAYVDAANCYKKISIQGIFLSKESLLKVFITWFPWGRTREGGGKLGYHHHLDGLWMQIHAIIIVNELDWSWMRPHCASQKRDRRKLMAE